MCGIAGIVASSGWDKLALQQAAIDMAATLYHRGPDAEGVWVDEQMPVALAHRRLSIQDLSVAGHQPMASASGRFHIVFNGEIYNFKILSNDLIKLGHRFRGHSDTEVLLEAFDKWGIERTLEQCRGMFAFAVWDTKSRELILCRDRMGEKPLFFGWLKNCFVFASELKALKKCFRDAMALNKSAFAAFLRFGYVPTPHCIYEHIYKLMPGTLLRIPVSPLLKEGAFSPFPGGAENSPKTYWRLESIARNNREHQIFDEHEAGENLDRLLRDAISQQKIADVPIGAFLSGGIDSSLVAAIMQAVSEKPIDTFTIGFKEKAYNEAPFARAVADHIGSNHHEYFVSADDALALVEQIPHYWDEPFADSSQLPSLLVSKMARQEVTVCLSGDGGDELFCGYNRYFASAALWSCQKKLPQWVRNIVSNLISYVPSNAWQDIYAQVMRLKRAKSTQANIGLKMQKVADMIKMGSLKEAYVYLLSYWSNPRDIFNHPEAYSIIDQQPNPGMGHFINDCMYWDQLGYLVDDNLVKGDRASMAVSLEVRMPLLDHRIVEFVWQLPLAMKYRRGQSKWLLRKTLYRYVPKKLVERPKMGFTVPIGEWLRQPLKNWAQGLIDNCKRGSMIELNYKNIQNIWKQHLSGSYDHSLKLWALCMWLSWDDYQGRESK